MVCTFNFPEIFPKSDQDDQFLHDKVLQELGEFLKEEDLEKKAVEAMDILHAAETLVLKFFIRNPQLDPDKAIDQVIAKNDRRGYYREKTK